MMVVINGFSYPLSEGRNMVHFICRQGAVCPHVAQDNPLLPPFGPAAWDSAKDTWFSKGQSCI